MWFPFTTGGKAAEITSKITKLPSYITKWSRLTTPDGQNGAKVYNLIYIDDNNIPEAGLYISKLASMYYEIEGFCWKGTCNECERWGKGTKCENGVKSYAPFH